MMFEELKGVFTVDKVKQLNPLVLAFVGDAVYEVFIRSYLVSNNMELSVHKLHVKAINFVKAHSQSEFMNTLKDLLNEEEMRQFKRGRNTKSGTVPKNANVQEYRNATGFEAVIGYLYLIEKDDRLNYFMKEIIKMSN